MDTVKATTNSSTLEVATARQQGRGITKKFIKALENARVEKDVEKAIERAYNNMLEDFFRRRYERTRQAKVLLSSPYRTDGVVRVQFPEALDFDSFKEDNFRVLIETKRFVDFEGNPQTAAAKIVAQAIYYLKSFQLNYDLPVPEVIVGGDDRDIFALSSHVVDRYLASDSYDWSLAPSSAGSKNSLLFNDLLKDKNITSLYVTRVNEHFDAWDFCTIVDELAKAGEPSKIQVDPHNLDKAFIDFQGRVFGGSTSETKLQTSLFVRALLGDSEVYLHPNRPNTLMYGVKNKTGELSSKPLTASQSLPFSHVGWETFFTKYDRNSYTLEDRKAITAIADRLFEEVDRRFTGDFWTPKIWVDEAHDLIEDQLGVDWKKNYVVWDAAAGTKNLTRDYKFSKLYSSTLHEEELSMAEDYNKEGVSFQYDFLNDDVDIHHFDGAIDFDDSIAKKEFKLPSTLLESLKNNEPIVFFMNPPYGQATTSNAKSSKDGISATAVGDLMKKDPLSDGSSELYAQFIYRVQLLAKTFNYTSNLHFFFFNKVFLTSPTFKKFTKRLSQDFIFEKGFLLNAGEFQGTDSSWGIIFSHWSLNKNEQNKEIFDFTVKESVLEGNSLNVVDTGLWSAKTAITPLLSGLGVKFSSIGKMKGNYPVLSESFSPPEESAQDRSVWFKDSLGAARLGKNPQNAGATHYIMSASFSNGAAISESNYEAVMCTFSSIRAIMEDLKDKGNLWIRDKDIFPSLSDSFMESPEWASFRGDSIIYSIFAAGSNQTALRNFAYGGKTWRINNEFFWKSREEVRMKSQELFSETRSDFWVGIETDLDTDSERYTNNWLLKHSEELSSEALKLLAEVNQIWDRSFKYREAYHRQVSKHSLQTWDAGWLQLYKMCFASRGRDGNSALPEAKNDKELQNLHREFKSSLKVLGNKIAAIYSKDTGF